MPGIKQNVHLHVMVTEDELDFVHTRMAEPDISDIGAYVRKMKLNSYILHVEGLTPVKVLVSLQRYCSNNLNQVGIHAHTYRRESNVLIELSALVKDNKEDQSLRDNPLLLTIMFLLSANQ